MATIPYHNLSDKELIIHIRYAKRIDWDDIDELTNRLESYQDRQDGQDDADASTQYLERKW